MKIHSGILIVLASILFAGSSFVSDGYKIGDTVSGFKLKNVDGKMIALDDYKSSKGVILIFDCNTCPYSKAYNDRIIGLHETYSPKGFPVVTINSNDPNLSAGDSFEEMVKRAKNKNYSFPYLFDETQAVAHAFGATNTPHVFVLQKAANNFKVSYIGAIDNNSRDASSADKKYVEDAVEALLSGKDVPVTKTKAIGCSIKYRNT
jgi:peroxiredoxin